MSSVNEYIARLDNFTLVPTLFIKLEQSNKFSIGGYVF